MTVALIPPLLGGWPDSRTIHEALTEAPRFIVKRHPQRHGRLWHRPRSGYLMLREWMPDEIVTIWNLWCGTSARGNQVEISEVDPVGEAVCATCEGRAVGAGQIPSSTTYRTEFTPRYATAPKWCPGGGRTGLWIEEPCGTRASSAAVCLVCGSHERVRYMGGYYTGGPGLTKHEPADGLMATRCDLHAWRHLVKVGAVVVCRCEVRS